MLTSSSDYGDSLSLVGYGDQGIGFVFRPASVAPTFDSIAHMEYEKELDLSVGGDVSLAGGYRYLKAVPPECYLRKRLLVSTV